MYVYPHVRPDLHKFAESKVGSQLNSISDDGYFEMPEISVVLMEAEMQEVGLYPALLPSRSAFPRLPPDGGNQNLFFRKPIGKFADRLTRYIK